METLKSLQERLFEHGFFLVNDGDYESALETINTFGTVFRRENITAVINSPAKLASNNEMALHTDHPSADYVAWFCESPASEGGESVIADAREILSSMPEFDIECLKKTNLKFPSLTEDKYYQYPLLSDRGVYFADWLIGLNRESLNQSVERLVLKIRSAKRQSILLKKGDLLLIDNRRMLHGRKGFFERDIKRKLIRHWIAADA